MNSITWRFPSLPDDQHWMEEGLATYVEPIARVQTGELKPKQIWHDMVRDMHKGEPAEGDQGLDHTHTWGRTYWGGAMFCLVADVEIRRQTGNKKGLQDALRAIVAAGGTIDHEWPLDKALAIGDKATGTHVLTEQYAKWKDAPVTVDLEKLWAELGIRRNGDAVEFVDDAPLAKVRVAIAHAFAIRKSFRDFERDPRSKGDSSTLLRAGDEGPRSLRSEHCVKRILRDTYHDRPSVCRAPSVCRSG